MREPDIKYATKVGLGTGKSIGPSRKRPLRFPNTVACDSHIGHAGVHGALA
jgi:hypothetical protein